MNHGHDRKFMDETGAELYILTGVDLCDPARMEKIVKKHGDRFLKRVYTPDEIEYCQRLRNPYRSYAARFAAKEAAMKLLGTGMAGVGFLSVEVISAGSGKPALCFHGAAKQKAASLGIVNTDLSLSHEKNMAIATATALARRKHQTNM